MADDDITRLAADEETRAASGPSRPSRSSGGQGPSAGSGHGPSAGSGHGPSAGSGQGWLSSSGSIDHGRFEPGTVVDGRYRIIGLLGRGGMGEVYRADDLRLGQQVALKVLPEALAHDAVRLAQFHNEVRTARQVSHPNVCRVYDIGDLPGPATTSGGANSDGQLYITMEYVDGEDLSSLIRRIGRLPEDKALEIARQICAGLAAAHDRGVLHRDLKPANIMLDGAGKARIMDFSLAAIGEVTDIRVGTPAYMAPEQLAGTEVTVRSDIYALGLVLYELFTGRRAFGAKTLGDLIEQQLANVITSPIDLVKTLDASIDRAILRCLDPDPLRRPASALMVSAALPGGDPLAAALAAGETPSPAMVAAAGTDESTLPAIGGLALVAACVVLMIVMAGLADRTTLLGRAPLDRAPSSLLDRARDLEKQFGYGSGVVDRASGLIAQPSNLAWANRHLSDGDRARLQATGRPPAVLFWSRSSPYAIVPVGDSVGPRDPPSLQAGMTAVVTDAEGRLVEFHVVPPQVEKGLTPAKPFDWTIAFQAAGLDFSRFTPADPEINPRAYADTRFAWSGTMTELPGTPVRVEAASHLGRPTFFLFVAPWNAPSASAAEGASATSIIETVATVIIVPGMMIAGALMARGNVRRGRGDRAGAARIALAMLVLSMAAWLFKAHHVSAADVEQQRVFKALGGSLFDAAVAWLFYLAAEPQVRRVWPHMLITWSRLVGGAFRDPMVGRDLAIGAICGLTMSVVSYAFYLVPGWLHWTPMDLRAVNPDGLFGARVAFGMFFDTLANALQNAMLGVLGMAVLRTVLSRVKLPQTWAAFSVAAVLFSFLAARGQFQSGHWMLDMTFGALLVVMILGAIVRYGLVAGIVAFFVHFWSYHLLVSLNPDQQYFASGLVGLGVVLAIALAGFVLARGRQPIFGRVMTE